MGTFPGKIFRREFLESYDIKFGTTKLTSYSNEDRGFVAPCKLILEYISTYDSNKRICFNSNVLYKRLWDKDSIT